MEVEFPCTKNAPISPHNTFLVLLQHFAGSNELINVNLVGIDVVVFELKLKQKIKQSDSCLYNCVLILNELYDE